MPDTASLLEEIDALKALLIASEARNQRKDERIERLEKLVAAFRQVACGRRSEKSDPDQFELALEDLEAAMVAVHAEEEVEDRAAKRISRPRATNRGSLPRHLPRIKEVIEPENLTCGCDGCLHRRRRCVGTAGHRPGTVPRDRDPPPEIRVPLLHRRRRSGSRTRAVDPGRHADRGDSRACAGQQIC